MGKKRVTPEEEFDRLAERIWLDYGYSDDIEDIDTYNQAFDEFFSEDVKKEPTNRQDTILRKEVFKSIRINHPSVVDEHLYKKVGRPKKAEHFEDKRKSEVFIYIGYVYNKKEHISKKVFTKKETLTYKTKKKGEKVFTERKREVFRDRSGRFASEKSFSERKGKKIHQVV